MKETVVIISDTKESTDLADANYDGRVDELDLDQIRKIICGNNVCRSSLKLASSQCQVK